MKTKMNKMGKQNIILIISSFFIGIIVAVILMKFMMPKSKNMIYERRSLADSVEKVENEVVAIETFSGKTQESTGSGFIYKKGATKAYVLTNEHVIDGNEIIVTNAKGDETQGILLGKDAYLDLAILEIPSSFAPQAATLGKSENVRVGDTVFAIGSPVGKRYQGSVSAGILSGKDRIVQTTLDGQESKEWLMNVLQFDAPLNPGNSGGPLYNVNGEVIGVCTLKLIQEGVEGMSFAIPIEYAINNMELLEKGKDIEWAELGVTMINANSAVQLEKYEIAVPDGLTKGAVVIEVKKNSGAYNKLRKGDVITKIDDLEVKDTSYVKYIVYKHKIGDKVTIHFLRKGKEMSTQITLKKQEKKEE